MLPPPPIAGSHTALLLLEHGHDVTIIDNLSNSFIRVLDHIKKLAGEAAARLKFVEVCASRRPAHAAACMRPVQVQRVGSCLGHAFACLHAANFLLGGLQQCGSTTSTAVQQHSTCKPACLPA